MSISWVCAWAPSISSGACQRNVPSMIKIESDQVSCEWTATSIKLERTRLRGAANAVDLGLHFALTKVGNDATRVIVDKYIGGLCTENSVHTRVGFYGWDSYLEITV